MGWKANPGDKRTRGHSVTNMFSQRTRNMDGYGRNGGKSAGSIGFPGRPSVRGHLLKLIAVMIVMSPVTAAAEIELFKPDELIQATTANDVERVLALVGRGRPPDTVDEKGRTPLILAASSGREEIVDVLLKHRAKPDRRDSLGNTAILYAAEGGHADVVKLLLEHGADVNAENRRGMSALMFAASAGNAGMVRLLLDHDANPSATDFTGRTALMWAERNNRRDVARLLKTRRGGQ